MTSLKSDAEEENSPLFASDIFRTDRRVNPGPDVMYEKIAADTMMEKDRIVLSTLSVHG